MLTVIRPDNQPQDIEPNANGRFVVNNPMEGLYALLARTTTGIATIPFYVKGAADAATEAFPSLELSRPS